MKVFLSCDIEGTNGICDWRETEIGTSDIGYFANRMTKEAAAVCNGINSFDSCAQIYVKDAHDSARNLDHDKLPLNVSLNRGWAYGPYSMMHGIDPSFDAAVFTGYHNAGGTDTNPLAHTMSFTSLVYLKINGRIASEFLVNYYSSLYNKVPVVMVSGDAGLCESVKSIDKNIYTVVTSVGLGGSVTSEHPSLTLKKLEETARKALEERAKMSLALPDKFIVEVYHKNHKNAYKHSFFPGAYAVDANITGYECTDYLDFLKFFMFRPS